MIRISTSYLWLLLALFAVAGYLAGRLARHAAITRLQNRVGRLEGLWRRARTDRDRAQEHLHAARAENERLVDDLAAVAVDASDTRRQLAWAIGHPSVRPLRTAGGDGAVTRIGRW